MNPYVVRLLVGPSVDGWLVGPLVLFKLSGLKKSGKFHSNALVTNLNIKKGYATK